MNKSWYEYIEPFTAVFVFILACSAFALSFSAIADLAVSFGISRSLAWLFPVLIDGAVVVASLSILRAELTKDKAVMGWGLLGIGTLSSFAFNVGHSGVEWGVWSGENILHLSLSAVPPLFLAWSFHMLTKQVGHTAEKTNLMQSLIQLSERITEQKQALDKLKTERETKQSQVDTLTNDRTKLMDTIQSLKAEIDILTNEKESLVKSIDRIENIEENDKYTEFIKFVMENPNATYEVIGNAIGRSKSTVYQYAKQLQSDGLLHKNGNGWEVMT